jgi:hypothetical protein
VAKDVRARMETPRLSAAAALSAPPGKPEHADDRQVSSSLQTQVIQSFTDDSTNETVSVLVQRIRLSKQTYVYVGLSGDTRSSLESMSIGMLAGGSAISTVILPSTKKTQNNDTESRQLSQMLCRRAGMPVVVSYNIPPGTVSDAVKGKIYKYVADGS